MDLAIEVLLSGRNSRVPQIHGAIVPEVISVRDFRHALLALTSGTRSAQETQIGSSSVAARSISKRLVCAEDQLDLPASELATAAARILAPLLAQRVCVLV
jgi:hypothetical protein